MKWFKKHKNENYPDFWQAYENSFIAKLPEDISNVTFVLLDTETTGFDYKEDRILSIGALTLKNKTIAINTAFEVYVEQEKYSFETVKIHGILKKGVRKKITEIEALKQLLHYLEGTVLVAHHAGFDVTMINKALKRNGLPKLVNKVLDTSTLYKKTLLTTHMLHKKDSYSLDELAEKFSLSTIDRHTAIGDAYITAIAFLKIVSRLKPKKLRQLF